MYLFRGSHSIIIITVNPSILNPPYVHISYTFVSYVGTSDIISICYLEYHAPRRLLYAIERNE